MYIGMEVTSKSVDEKSNTKRFEVLVNQNDFSDIRETRIPKTTQANTKWAAKVWNDWAENRNSIGVTVSQYDRVPIDFSEGPFYRRPLARSDGKVQFSLQVIGKNLLGDYMSRMFKSAGIEGEYTNHCGKVTTATALYQAGVSEDLIMKRTGHRSIDAVRVYKRPSDEQLRHVSDLLQPPSSKKESKPDIDTISNTGGQRSMSNPAKNEMNDSLPKLPVSIALSEDADRSTCTENHDQPAACFKFTRKDVSFEISLF
ncbi:uncharacterized protein [Ptychodera flava]|uniref:uncharacterized protein isoform X2 n=1 Tax=Ptychodera flava TaxID=63121 RepID=UPI00396A2E10